MSTSSTAPRRTAHLTGWCSFLSRVSCRLFNLSHHEKHQRTTSGRILVHGQGSGSISRDKILRRARELADIDGRSGAEVSDDDMARALAELRGDHIPATTVEDDEARGALTRDPSEPASFTGRETPSREGPDEEKAIERMALEGVEEAQHDQMLASRRRDRHLGDNA